MYSQTHYVIEISCMAGEKGGKSAFPRKAKGRTYWAQ